jgi:hypothetical protein
VETEKPKTVEDCLLDGGVRNKLFRPARYPDHAPYTIVGFYQESGHGSGVSLNIYYPDKTHPDKKPNYTCISLAQHSEDILVGELEEQTSQLASPKTKHTQSSQGFRKSIIHGMQPH